MIRLVERGCMNSCTRQDFLDRLSAWVLARVLFFAAGSGGEQLENRTALRCRNRVIENIGPAQQ